MYHDILGAGLLALGIQVSQHSRFIAPKMKFETPLVISSLLSCQSAIGHILTANDGLADEIGKRQSATYPIVGPGGSGSIYPRYEIRELHANFPNQWTLFILAMQQFEAEDQAQFLSYYDISGIHGYPAVNWDGVDQCRNCTGAIGYCTHNSVLFPSWHRV